MQLSVKLSDNARVGSRTSDKREKHRDSAGSLGPSRVWSRRVDATAEHCRAWIAALSRSPARNILHTNCEVY